MIENIQNIVGTVLGDGLKTLTGLLETIKELKGKYLTNGIKLIQDTIENVYDFIKNVTEQAAELGIDISKCITGRDEQLKELSIGLVGKLTSCVTDVVSDALTMVNNDIIIINKIVGNVTAIPAKLTKCLISLRPISCLENLIVDLTTMLKNLPGQIIGIVNEATSLVAALPVDLSACINNISGELISQTTNIIADIATCVDDIVSGESTAVVPKASIGELIEQVKKIIENLNNLVSGIIGDALGILQNIVKTIVSIKEKILTEGLGLIFGTVGDVLDFIKNITSNAAELGIDIAHCVAGRQDQLQDLASGFALNLTDCVTDIVESALTMVNKDLVVINEIVSNITAAPVRLAKCLITLRPITCISNLITDLTSILLNAPKQIEAIIKNATDLIKDLPGDLYHCIDNIATSISSQANQIRSEIQKCVDDAIASSTTEPPTVAQVIRL